MWTVNFLLPACDEYRDRVGFYRLVYDLTGMSVSVNLTIGEFRLVFMCFFFFSFHFSNNSVLFTKIKLLHNHWYVIPTFGIYTLFTKASAFDRFLKIIYIYNLS